MKVLKMIFGNFKNNALRNLIMIIFVGISVFLLNISLSRFMHQEYINNVVRDCGLYDNFMYAAPPNKKAYRTDSDNGEGTSTAALNYVRGQLENLKSCKIIDNYFTLGHFKVGDDNAEYLIYPQELAIDLKFPVSKGKWFDVGDFADNLTPIVVGSGLSGRFKVGESVEVPGIVGNCVVTGILERDAMVLTIGAGGNGMDLNSTFISGNNAIIACVPQVDEIDDCGGTIIKTAPQNQKEVINKVSDISYTFTFKNLAQNAYESNCLNTEMQTTVFILMMVVCVAGVSSGNLLATISCKKKYATYFLCGMDWKTGVLTTLAESLIKLAVPAAVGYAMFYKWCVDQNFWALRVTDVNLILTIVFLIVIFLLTSLKPLLDIKHTSPVRIIVEM